MIKAVLFDLDGTIVDTSYDLIDALNCFLLQNSMKPISFIKAREKCSDGARGLLSLRLNMNDISNEYINEYLECYSATNYSRSRLFPLFDHLIEILKNDGIAWGIVTNKPRKYTIPLLEKLHIQNYDCLVCGDDYEYRKPDPMPIFKALATINVKAKHALYVGDAQRDMEAGINAGAQVIFLDYGYGKFINNKDNCENVVSSPRDMVDLIKFLIKRD